MGVSAFNSSVSSVGFSFNTGKANSNISKFQATAKAPSFKPELLTFEDKIEKVSNIEENDSLGEKIAKTAVDVGCTYVVTMTSVYSGYKKFEERITDGIVNAGTGLISGILHIVGNDAAAKSVEEWGMDYIAVDQVAEANKMFYEGTTIGKFINNNSYMKYDSKTAQGIQTVTEKVTFVAAATALTVASGGAAAAGMGAVYGMGESAESHYQADDRGNYWDLKNVGGIAIDSALSAAEAYGAGQMGATAINAAGSLSKLGASGAKEIAKEKLSQMSLKEGFNALKTKGGSMLKGAAINTFKDKDFYIDTATTIAGDVKTGIATGEWDFGHMVLSTAAAYGTNFASNMTGEFIQGTFKNSSFSETISLENQKELYNSTNSRYRYQIAEDTYFGKNSLPGYDRITPKNADKYLVGSEFNGEFAVNCDWPKEGGYDPSTIKSAGELSGKMYVDRYGGDSGHAMGIGKNADGTPFTASQRVIPVKEVNLPGMTFDADKYKSVIDVVADDTLSNVQKAQKISNMGISCDQVQASNLTNEYKSYFDFPEMKADEKGILSITGNTDVKYGVYGKAAPKKDWKGKGGAGQFNSMLSWGSLKDLGIVY